MTGLTDLVGQEPVAVLGLLAVGVEQRVGEVGLLPVAGRFRRGEPAVGGLSSEVQDPAREGDGDTVAGELSHEREAPFPGKFA